MILRGLRTASALLLTAGGLEVAARCWPAAPALVAGSCAMATPESGFLSRPRCSHVDSATELDVTYMYNELGLRDRSGTEFRNGQGTVVMLGDSLVEGIGLQVRETVPSRLQTLLRPARGLRVLNAGLRHTGPSAQAKRFRTAVWQFYPARALVWVLSPSAYLQELARGPGGIPGHLQAFYLRLLAWNSGVSELVARLATAGWSRELAANVKNAARPGPELCAPVSELAELTREDGLPFLIVLAPAATALPEGMEGWIDSAELANGYGRLGQCAKDAGVAVADLSQEIADSRDGAGWLAGRIEPRLTPLLGKEDGRTRATR